MIRPRLRLVSLLACLTLLAPALAQADPADDLYDAMQGGHCEPALTALRARADAHEASAQHSMAFAAERGVCMPADATVAAGWFRKAAASYRTAAEKGDAEAQANLGALLAEGQGVDKDVKAAVAWFRKAAEQGRADAQAALAWAYHTGEGLDKDESQAVAWYRKAAAQGNVDAQFNLGLMLLHGQGVAADEQQAMLWLGHAAEQGEAAAQVTLGLVYRRHGDDASLVNALWWFRQAATAGDADGAGVGSRR